MMQKRNRYYWLLQLSGWGLLALMFVLVYEFSDQRVDARLIEQLAVLIFSGIVTTHLFRAFIHRSNWLQLPVEKAAPKFLIAVVILCLVAALIRISIIPPASSALSRLCPAFGRDFLIRSSARPCCWE